MTDTSPTAPPPTIGTHRATKANDGSRSKSGSNYGDFAPDAKAGRDHDPSHGSELERDALPPDADFSVRPDGAESSDPVPPVKPT